MWTSNLSFKVNCKRRLRREYPFLLLILQLLTFNLHVGSPTQSSVQMDSQIFKLVASGSLAPLSLIGKYVRLLRAKMIHFEFCSLILTTYSRNHIWSCTRLNFRCCQEILRSEWIATIQVSSAKVAVVVKFVAGKLAVIMEYRMGSRTLPCRTQHLMRRRVFCMAWQNMEVRIGKTVLQNGIPLIKRHFLSLNLSKVSHFIKS